MSDAKHLQKTLQQLNDNQGDDLRLRDHLEGLAHDPRFPELTWYWGPMLYQRNRVVFRSLILNYFSDWRQKGSTWRRIPWSKHAERLQPWLDATRCNRDTALVRQLLRWKYAAKSWGIDQKAWNAALQHDFKCADTPATRAIVLDEYDGWFELDEETALALYQQDAKCGAFILKHLPTSFWSGDKRKLWERLSAAALKSGDEQLHFELYRRQVPIKRWQADVLALSRDIEDASQLNQALELRHPQGYGLKLGSTITQLLETRGRDVMPYVRNKLKEIAGGWLTDNLTPLIDLAERQEWWDLWTAAIRSSHKVKRFNAAVTKVLENKAMSEEQILERLSALAGVSRDWNWPGFGLAQVHALDDVIAARLYRRFPALIHGPFKPHVMPTWWHGYPQLLAATKDADDEDLIDLLASRYATQASFEPSFPASKETKRLLATAESLGEYYQSIRERDPSQFTRRAANVLTRIPAYAIFNYRQLLRTNTLARLLFVRSFEAYLAEPSAIRDLVEGSEIHVQMLAYRILAQDDTRARHMAKETLEILIATLLRPLHRNTRLAAFGALLNAACADIDSARLILHRAREALRLPDKRYPKEQLVGLIGEILHTQPLLCTPNERPVIYGREEQFA